MSGQTVAITGSNRGIGLEMSRIFLARGDRVIGLCRQASAALRETGADIVEGMDVTSLDQVRQAAQRVDAERIDVLVNDAGILSHQDFEQLDDADAVAEMLQQYRVNALGPLL